MPKLSLTTPPKVDWHKVADEVNRRTGKDYSAQYVREIGTGWRAHKSIRPILDELGVTRKRSAAKAAA